MKFVHSADWHYGYRQYGFYQRELDFYSAGIDLAEKVIQSKADALIVAGDIFDSPKPPAMAVLAVQAVVRMLDKNGIPVFAIDGNHDFTSGHWLQVCNIRTISTTVEYKGIRIRGIDAARPAVFNTVLDQLVAANEKIDVIVIHQALGELADFQAREITAMEMAPKLTKLGVRYVAMGDIHDYHEMDLGGIRFVYSGSIEMNAIDEKQDKSMSLVDITKDELHTSSMPLQIRPIYERHLRTQEDMDMILADIDKCNRPPLVVIWYEPEQKELAHKVEALLKDRGIMFRVVPLSSMSIGTIAQKLARESLERKGALLQLKDAVTTFFDEKSDQYQLVFQLLEAPDNTTDIIKQYMKTKGLS